jgi:hypothetical protein
MATTLTASDWTSLAPSSSVTLIVRYVSAGPSAKKHLKLPPVAVVASEPVTNSPFVPQVG